MTTKRKTLSQAAKQDSEATDLDATAIPAESDNAPGVWLEIDGETIVGTHNYRCQSELTWVKYEGEEDVLPGNLWRNNKIVSPTVEHTVEDIQAAATRHITKAYPTWKQLNILREGNKQEVDKMSQFIDAVRDWSNKPKPKNEDLERITP